MAPLPSLPFRVDWAGAKRDPRPLSLGFSRGTSPHPNDPCRHSGGARRLSQSTHQPGHRGADVGVACHVICPGLSPSCHPRRERHVGVSDGTHGAGNQGGFRQTVAGDPTCRIPSLFCSEVFRAFVGRRNAGIWGFQGASPTGQEASHLSLVPFLSPALRCEGWVQSLLPSGLALRDHLAPHPTWSFQIGVYRLNLSATEKLVSPRATHSHIGNSNGREVHSLTETSPASGCFQEGLTSETWSDVS